MAGKQVVSGLVCSCSSSSRVGTAISMVSKHEGRTESLKLSSPLKHQSWDYISGLASETGELAP